MSADATDAEPAVRMRKLAACIGQCIRRRRLLLKLRQQDVAERIGSSRPLVCRVESGLHVITIETLERYASALGCAPSALMSEAEALLASAGDLVSLPDEVAI